MTPHLFAEVLPELPSWLARAALRAARAASKLGCPQQRLLGGPPRRLPFLGYGVNIPRALQNTMQSSISIPPCRSGLAASAHSLHTAGVTKSKGRKARMVWGRRASCETNLGILCLNGAARVSPLVFGIKKESAMIWELKRSSTCITPSIWEQGRVRNHFEREGSST